MLLLSFNKIQFYFYYCSSSNRHGRPEHLARAMHLTSSGRLLQSTICRTTNLGSNFLHFFSSCCPNCALGRIVKQHIDECVRKQQRCVLSTQQFPFEWVKFSIVVHVTVLLLTTLSRGEIWPTPARRMVKNCNLFIIFRLAISQVDGCNFDVHCSLCRSTSQRRMRKTSSS